ncbi:MAG: hypothetical protein OMM_05149 [Candidatus Magnetoglobus multicellularis str. Araruama]|uniref:Uncharacterized protein n=1 Tax=Candidatus Magnetoglobus multicellularis str. Araruama TaxID=890399 RepID=A0A1V1NXY1_9BACT|nr:MAG: hypothetical protein OMM_05149 [Candidatus Magnetoglobus multicellularis str. Araruama]
MNIIQFYQKELKTIHILPIFLYFSSGIAEVIILILIVSFCSSYSNIYINYKFFFINYILYFKFLFYYIIFLSLFMIGKKYAFNRLIKLFMLAMQQVTERVTDKIRNSELDFIEKIGKESIYKELTYNSENYNQFLVDALNAVYSTIIVCMSFFMYGLYQKKHF